jgi:hypothetical protein
MFLHPSYRGANCHKFSASSHQLALDRLALGGCVVMAQFECHPEQALFAQRRIWASRAVRRVFGDALIARLARFLIKLPYTFCVVGLLNPAPASTLQVFRSNS